MAITDQCRVHGSQLVLVDATIVQVLGLPSPPGLIPVIPKYRPCAGPSPWSGRSGVYCRVTRKYGPLGVEEGIEASGLRVTWDPMYRAYMPYVRDYDVSICLEPQAALEKAVARGEPSVTLVVDELRSMGISIRCLGLTGSRALGIAHSGSDVDLVVYECRERMYEVFKEMSSNWGEPELGGLVIKPSIDASWRRARIKGVNVTWVPSQNLCPPLSSYWSIQPPNSKRRLLLHVEPGQPWSLGYPPCALSREGLWIVSYEYNLADILFRGGTMRIDGLVSVNDRIVYLGLREEPGSLLCSCTHT